MPEPVDDVRPGARVEGTDGVLGTIRDTSHQGFLSVETDDGLLDVPTALVRETRGDKVMLSLPVADVKGQSRPS